MSLAQGLVVDHTPPTIVANHDKARLSTMKKTVLIRARVYNRERGRVSYFTMVLYLCCNPLTFGETFAIKVVSVCLTTSHSSCSYCSGALEDTLTCYKQQTVRPQVCEYHYNGHEPGKEL